MPHITRRAFLRHASTTVAATAAASPFLVRAESPNAMLRYAAIGCGGKGESDLSECAVGKYVKVAALCDVDANALGKAAKLHPGATTFDDWRKLLDGVKIDAVTVSTPDHMHAPISVSAMQRGIHVYCQKPLTHSVREARVMTQLAAEKNLVTQMGIQLHSSSYLKLGVAMFRTGVIGKVSEVHVWTDRPIWPQGIGRPRNGEAAPANLNWDHWLGVAPSRPYVGGVYHPFNWRGWIDFGTGAMGDMGCHIIDPVLSCIELGPPKWIRSKLSPPNDETFPAKSIIEYEFDPTPHTLDKPIRMTWYDGKELPPREALRFDDNFRTPANGAVLVGEKGTLFMAYDHRPVLSPGAAFADYKPPRVEPVSHYTQWTDACRGEGKTTTPFSYSGPLTETVLLGNIALWYPGETLKWDSHAMKFDKPQANQRLKRAYRKGWEVEGLA